MACQSGGRTFGYSLQVHVLSLMMWVKEGLRFGGVDWVGLLGPQLFANASTQQLTVDSSNSSEYRPGGGVLQISEAARCNIDRNLPLSHPMTSRT